MWILREIERRGGELGFQTYMELALYHPEHGYYSSERRPWGRDGDYLTAPTASSWYGAVCAGLIGELADGVGGTVDLIDLAAGDGSFLASVLDAAGSDGSPPVRAVAVERSARRREQISARLPGVEVWDNPGRSGPFVVMHASELYDAMPVHRVEQTGDGLMELTVLVDGQKLGWGRRPAAVEVASYLDSHGVELEVGQAAEINLEAEPYHRRLLDLAGDGIVLVLDYGYPAARLYDPRGRRRGSLATYRRHELGRDVLEDPGERDLTAHVNWDDLRRAADSAGWSEIGLMPLAEFLVRAGLGRLLEARGLGMEAELDAATVCARQEVKQLLDPEGMGSDLKMLVQGRGRLGELAAKILMREV